MTDHDRELTPAESEAALRQAMSNVGRAKPSGYASASDFFMNAKHEDLVLALVEDGSLLADIRKGLNLKIAEAEERARFEAAAYWSQREKSTQG